MSTLPHTVHEIAIERALHSLNLTGWQLSFVLPPALYDAVVEKLEREGTVFETVRRPYRESFEDTFTWVTVRVPALLPKLRWDGDACVERGRGTRVLCLNLAPDAEPTSEYDEYDASGWRHACLFWCRRSRYSHWMMCAFYAWCRAEWRRNKIESILHPSQMVIRHLKFSDRDHDDKIERWRYPGDDYVFVFPWRRIK